MNTYLKHRHKVTGTAMALLLLIYSLLYPLCFAAPDSPNTDTGQEATTSDNSTADTGGFAGGSGTPSDPYLIASAQQLLAFNALCQGEEGGAFLSACYLLIEDITLSPQDDCNTIKEDGNWLAVGSPQAPFTGSFNGGGFCITGITTQEKPGENTPQGFFAAAGGHILNVSLRNLYITGTDDTGGLVGLGLPGLTIEQCTVAGTVTGGTRVGGILGSATTTADALVTLNAVAGCATVTGSHSAGGILGAGEYVSISQSYCTALVSAQSDTGGIAGSVKSSNILNCYTTGDVNAAEHSAGGIVGTANSALIKHCYTTGKITTLQGAGGIAGSVADEKTPTDLDGCGGFSSSILAYGAPYTAGRILGQGSARIKNCFALESMTLTGAAVAPGDLGVGPSARHGASEGELASCDAAVFTAYGFNFTPTENKAALWVLNPVSQRPTLLVFALGLPTLDNLEINYYEESVQIPENIGYSFDGLAYEYGPFSLPLTDALGIGQPTVYLQAATTSECFGTQATLTLPGRPSAPTGPAVTLVDINTLHIEQVVGQEYTLDDGIYLANPALLSLSPAITYTVTTRIAATDTSFASVPSQGVEVKIPGEPSAPAAAQVQQDLGRGKGPVSVDIFSVAALGVLFLLSLGFTTYTFLHRKPKG